VREFSITAVSEGYQKGRLSLPQLAERLSGEAARLYGLAPEKGALMKARTRTLC
jgi:dihydroorotase-like cyclic amidohydrolase